MNALHINGNDLTLEAVREVACERRPVLLLPEAREQVNVARAVVDELVANHQVSYAITTGVGKLSDVRIAGEQIRELQVNLQVEVTWEDVRTGKILQQQRVALPPELLQLAAQAEFAPEVGQSLATADQTAIDRLARNIVDMMEVPW